jgi:hypothetical protein
MFRIFRDLSTQKDGRRLPVLLRRKTKAHERQENIPARKISLLQAQ